jgi:hypothetical protein
MTPSIEKIKEMLATNGLYPKAGKSDEEIIDAAKKIIQWTLGMQVMQNKRELNENKRNNRELVGWIKLDGDGVS